MKKTTLLMIGALAFVLQSASAQYNLYTDNFEGQTIGGTPVTTPYPGADTGTGSEGSANIWIWTGGTASSSVTVQNVLSTDGFGSTLAEVASWQNSDPSAGWFGMSHAENPSVAAGTLNALSDITLSFDVNLQGTAAASTDPITVWLDQFPGGPKTFDASYAATLTPDGNGWAHVSVTLDNFTPSGTSGAYWPTYGLQIAIDGGSGVDSSAGATGSFTFDNISLDATNPTPEPGTITLLTLGGLGALVAIRRRRA
jgi:MYXO-CTERM domain-containing protein